MTRHTDQQYPSAPDGKTIGPIDPERLWRPKGDLKQISSAVTQGRSPLKFLRTQEANPSCTSRTVVWGDHLASDDAGHLPARLAHLPRLTRRARRVMPGTG